MGNIVLKYGGGHTFVKIGRPEFRQDRLDKRLYILCEQIRLVWASGRQSNFSAYLSKHRVLHFVIIEELSAHLVKKDD